MSEIKLRLPNTQVKQELQESRASATSKMEYFMIIVNGWPLDIAAALDLPLLCLLVIYYFVFVL